MSFRIPFLPSGFDHEPALLSDDETEWVSYQTLRGYAERWAERLKGPRGLAFLYPRNNVESVAALLGALGAGHVVALFDPNLSVEARARLEARYRPDWLIETGAQAPIHGPLNSEPVSLDPGLGLLLSTSGSTGSPKLVRLTMGAVQFNAACIASVLAIRADDVAVGYLPLHYSYGLSVLTSHLCQGARVRLTERGLMDRQFWPLLRDAAVTHFPGVPFHYQILSKLGFSKLNLSSLRTMTQAGGAMDVALQRQVHAFMSELGGAFYVLYGQTEAAPRMATLQHDDFPLAEGSVGTALPGCRFEILQPNENGVGEVVFHGPNVMMGYAEAVSDLALGDMHEGRLETGDIGWLDNAGRLYLTGRAKRLGKVFGLRINLDEIEREGSKITPVAVLQVGEGLRVIMRSLGDEVKDTEQARLVLDHLMKRFTIPRAGYSFRSVEEIPHTERGKIDYSALEHLE